MKYSTMIRIAVIVLSLATICAVGLSFRGFGDDLIHFVSYSRNGSEIRVRAAADDPFHIRLRDPTGKVIFSKDSEVGWFRYRHTLTLKAGCEDGELTLDGTRMGFKGGAGPSNGGAGTAFIPTAMNLHLDWEEGYGLWWGD